jgi:hypothetical protein
MDQTTNERLERLTRLVAKAGGIGDGEAEKIGASPFLQARLRAGIEIERRRRSEQGSGWLATLLIASRAITIMALVTIAAVLMLWFSRADSAHVISPLNPTDDPVSRVVTGGTCALSSTDECAISTGEVLATLFSENVGRQEK